jgi:hypothetical protein
VIILRLTTLSCSDDFETPAERALEETLLVVELGPLRGCGAEPTWTAFFIKLSHKEMSYTIWRLQKFGALRVHRP